jgi:hypothetical protein
LRIGADAPAPLALKLDLLSAQDAPDLIDRNIAQGFGHEPAIPLAEACRRWLVEHREDSLLAGAVIAMLAPRARGVLKSGETLVGKPLPPPAHRAGPLTEARGNKGRPLAGSRGQDDSSAMNGPLLARTATDPMLERGLLVRTQGDDCGVSHSDIISCIYAGKH